MKISKRWKTLKTIWDGGSQDGRKWFSERKCWFWICCLVSWNCMEQLLWRYCQMICEYFLALHHTSIISFRGKLSSVLTCHWAGPSKRGLTFYYLLFPYKKVSDTSRLSWKFQQVLVLQRYLHFLDFTITFCYHRTNNIYTESTKNTTNYYQKYYCTIMISVSIQFHSYNEWPHTEVNSLYLVCSLPLSKEREPKFWKFQKGGGRTWKNTFGWRKGKGRERFSTLGF